MCFGNTVTTEQKQTNNTLPSYLENAAQSNVSNAANVTSQPFQSYTGQLTAPMTANEGTAGGLLSTVAGSSDPYSGTAAGLYGSYASTPGSTISAPSIIGPNTNVNTSSIQDYMNPYLDASLTPTLQAIARQGASARQTINAGATSAGAFGDARQGVETANQMRDENTLVGNTVGQAYNTAFNTAAGLRGTDITNSINTQEATAADKELALQRQAAGATDLTNLDKYDTGRTVDLAQALEQQGATERGVNQTADTAKYNEFLRQVGYSPQMLQLMTQVLAGTPHDTSTDSTTQAPDNSGYGLLGTVLGAVPKLLTGGFLGGGDGGNAAVGTA